MGVADDTKLPPFALLTSPRALTSKGRAGKPRREKAPKQAEQGNQKIAVATRRNRPRREKGGKDGWLPGHYAKRVSQKACLYRVRCVQEGRVESRHGAGQVGRVQPRPHRVKLFSGLQQRRATTAVAAQRIIWAQEPVRLHCKRPFLAV